MARRQQDPARLPLNVRCPNCDEEFHATEPCRCEREVLRRAPPPAADTAGAACADSQHYACAGYLSPDTWEWRRCRCACHESDREAEMAPIGWRAVQGGQPGRGDRHALRSRDSMEADSMLEVDYQKASGYTVCRAVGELDGASAPRLREALTGDPAPDRLVIDLTGVSFVDSAGLGALIGGIRRTREASGAVAISTPRPGLTRVLRTAGFDRIVPMEPTVEAAAAALGAEGTTIDPSAA